jgi:hypothetical protein
MLMPRSGLLVGLPLALVGSACGMSLRAGPELRSQATGTVLEGRGTIVGALAGAGDRDAQGAQLGIPLSVSGGSRLSDGKAEGTFESGIELTQVSGHFGYRADARGGAEFGHTSGGYFALRGGPVWMIDPAREDKTSRVVTLEGLLGGGTGDLRGAALYGACLSFGWDTYPPPLRIPSGRPLRAEDGSIVRGKFRLGPQRAATMGTRCLRDERERIGLRYLDDALDEHASVAAFERLSRELAAHEAPAPLVARARSAARDEARHARTCFALAAAHLGRSVAFAAPPSLRPRRQSLDEIAYECLVDGCLGEGVAAEVVWERAQRASEPAVKRSLLSIAADEWRHARLARDVLAWCLPLAFCH